MGSRRTMHKKISYPTIKLSKSKSQPVTVRLLPEKTINDDAMTTFKINSKTKALYNPDYARLLDQQLPASFTNVFAIQMKTNNSRDLPGSISYWHHCENGLQCSSINNVEPILIRDISSSVFSIFTQTNTTILNEAKTLTQNRRKSLHYGSDADKLSFTYFSFGTLITSQNPVLSINHQTDLCRNHIDENYLMIFSDQLSNHQRLHAYQFLRNFLFLQTRYLTLLINPGKIENIQALKTFDVSI